MILPHLFFVSPPLFLKKYNHLILLRTCCGNRAQKCYQIVHLAEGHEGRGEAVLLKKQCFHYLFPSNQIFFPLTESPLSYPDSTLPKFCLLLISVGHLGHPLLNLLFHSNFNHFLIFLSFYVSKLFKNLLIHSANI